MSRIELTLALGDYDHTRDLCDGVVQPDGIDLRHLKLPIEETFHRFIKFREFDVSEMSFAKFASFASQGGSPFVGIPVFPSRVFRLSSLYIGAGGRVKAPGDLDGARIGVPEWAQTAAVYTRGYIRHEIGVPLERIDWVQAGVNDPGRVEKVELKLPAGIRYRPEPKRSLNDMLLEGDIDVALSARAPRAFEQGDARVRRLFPDFRSLEEAHYRKTRIFPVMHVIAIRRDVYERDRWIAMSLYKGFEEAKARSLERMADITASHAPLAWLSEHFVHLQQLFGADPFPYGIEPNRPTLTAFLDYAAEQGVCHKRMAPEELFVPEVQSAYKI